MCQVGRYTRVGNGSEQKYSSLATGQASVQRQDCVGIYFIDIIQYLMVTETGRHLRDPSGSACAGRWSNNGCDAL